MKEKLMSLSLVQLRDIAKREGLKRISTLRKAELVDRLVEYEEQKSRDLSASAAEETHKPSADVRKEEPSGRSDRRQEKAAAEVHIKKEQEKAAVSKKEFEKKKTERKDISDEAGNTKQNNPRTSEKKNYTKKYRTSRTAPGSEKGRKNVHVKRSEKADMQVREKDHYSVRRNDTGHPNDHQDSGKKAEYRDIPQAELRESGEPVKNQTVSSNERKPVQRSENRQNSVHTENGEPRTEHADNHSDNRGQQHTDGIPASGILEVMPDGYGFIRCENYLPGENDVYVSPSLIRRFNLKTGDIITGNTKAKTAGEKFGALLFVSDVNGFSPFEAQRRMSFENMTPIFPNERIHLETENASVSMRIMDLIAPVGKGQRGMIVSPPKAGKTTLLKEVAKSVIQNNPEIHIIILLIDERPEEVTDMKEDVEGENVEVIYSTFDELAEHHKRVSEMVIERAKRLVEHHKDVMILLDSITRLARAYNLVVPPSGRTLSGGLDPAALHMPKRFFGAARNMREGGSLTILATALVDTGSKMDDVVYEEFKGTGNMELVLDRNLSERRIFPAIDIVKSGTRRDDLLLSRQEQETMNIVRRNINGMKTEEAVETILHMFVRTKSNEDFVKFFLKKKYS